MIDPAVLGAEGRLVKCTKCENTWVETPPQELLAEAPAESPTEFPEPESVPEVAEDTAESGTDFSALLEEAAGQSAEAASAPQDDFGAVSEPEPAIDIEPEPDLETERLEAAAARRARRERTELAAHTEKRGRAGAVMWTLLVIVVVGVLGAGFALRDTVIQMWPAAERIYEMVGLEREPLGAGFEIRNVESKTFERDGRKVLAISGEIANISKDVREVPRLQGQLFDEKQKELQRWTFTVPETKLLPGEHVSFSTELNNPPEGAAKLTVKFTDRL